MEILIGCVRNSVDPFLVKVVHAHFWLKRREIEQQCENWIAEMEAQVKEDPNGSRAVAVSLTALKVLCVPII